MYSISNYAITEFIDGLTKIINMYDEKIDIQKKEYVRLINLEIETGRYQPAAEDVNDYLEVLKQKRNAYIEIKTYIYPKLIRVEEGEE